MSRIKSCINCSQPFFGRRDAKTCSVRCRKALQRHRELLEPENKIESLKRYAMQPRPVAGGTSVMARHPSPRRIKNRGGLKHLAAILVFGALASLMVFGHSALAVVSQGFVTDDKNLRQYMAVSLSDSNSQGHPVVQSSSINQADNAIGIAVGLSDSLLAVAPQSSQVYVVSQGPTKAYVSDIKGLPKKGDRLAVSPLRGILMKADKNSKKVLGNALKDFSLEGSQTITAQDSAGKSMQVHVGLVDINLAINPPLTSTVDPSTNWLSNLGASITGRQISSIRVLAGLAIFFTLMVVEGEIIYSTVSSSIIALGRNPLARKTIIRQSFHSVGVASIILIAGIGVIAMLMWA